MMTAEPLVRPSTSGAVSREVEAADILIVDDHDGVREALRSLLELEGYEVASFGGGEAALAYLRHHAAPSLILLDLMMPEMDGWELAGILREMKGLESTAVVLLSGVEEVGKQAPLLEADGFLRKPVDADVLLRIAELYCH